jgi:hypothetical protein
MRHLLVALSVLSLLIALGCDSAREEAKELNEARKELVNDVGGAPKAQVEQARAILNTAEKDMEAKGAAAIDQATAE